MWTPFSKEERQELEQLLSGDVFYESIRAARQGDVYALWDCCFLYGYGAPPTDRLVSFKIEPSRVRYRTEFLRNKTETRKQIASLLSHHVNHTVASAHERAAASLFHFRTLVEEGDLLAQPGEWKECFFQDIQAFRNPDDKGYPYFYLFPLRIGKYLYALHKASSEPVLKEWLRASWPIPLFTGKPSLNFVRIEDLRQHAQPWFRPELRPKEWVGACTPLFRSWSGLLPMAITPDLFESCVGVDSFPPLVTQAICEFAAPQQPRDTRALYQALRESVSPNVLPDASVRLIVLYAYEDPALFSAPDYEPVQDIDRDAEQTVVRFGSSLHFRLGMYHCALPRHIARETATVCGWQTFGHLWQMNTNTTSNTNTASKRKRKRKREGDEEDESESVQVPSKR
jgi:hypothetical protein